MAIFKQCTWCGTMIHGGDGFYRKRDIVFCCTSCAEYALDITNAEAETLYTELVDNVYDEILPHEKLLEDMAEFIEKTAILDSVASELLTRYKELYKI